MIWMRSGRKFSTKPMSAMPGRLMSLTVISRREASVSVSCSSCSSCRWSSNRRATLSASTLTSVLARGFVGGRLPAVPGNPPPVRAAGPALAADALLLEAPELPLEPVGREIDRDLRLGGFFAANQLVVVEPQRDLGAVPVALGGDDQVRLVDVAREFLELLEAPLGVESDFLIELTVTRGGEDLHRLPRAARLGDRARARRPARRPVARPDASRRHATRRRKRAGRILNCSRYFPTVRRAIRKPRSWSSSAIRWSESGPRLSSSSMSVLMISLAVRA